MFKRRSGALALIGALALVSAPVAARREDSPAEFLNALDTVGTIERGKRADLVLLTANPLDNIANTEKRAGVMARGRWLPRTELQKQLDEIALRFQNQWAARRRASD